MANLPSHNLDRLPPQALEAEMSVLGCVLLDRDGIIKIADQVTAEDFYDNRHRLIYDVILQLFTKNIAIDILTVSNLLGENKNLERAGGTSYITELVNIVPNSAHIVHYASIVRKKGTLRRLISSASDITQLAYTEAGEIENILDEAEQKLYGVTQKHLKQNFIPIVSILHETFERIDELHRDKGKYRGVPTGYVDLDNILGGLQKSDLVVLAARPSMGKTSLALEIVKNVSIQSKIPTAIFSLEMSKDQLVDRLLASEADVNLWKIRTGNLTEKDFESIGEAMGTLGEAQIFIDDAAGSNIMEVRTKARRLQQEHKIGLIVIDYLQLMSGHNTDNRVQEVSEISRSLKILARELNVPVLALSQLSRSVEQRPDKVPQLSDLRESGCLTGESLVTMAETGVRVPMRELIGKSGFSVWALNESTFKLEPATVTHAFSTGKKPIYKLTTRLGKVIRATGNHKFRSFNGWKRLDEFTVGEHLALPRKIPAPNDSESKMSTAELGLLGHLIGDGCTLPRHVIQYTTNDFTLAGTVTALATIVFGNQINPRIKRERNWYQVYLPASFHLTHGKHNPIKVWLDELGIFGLRSYEKFIPEKIFQQTQDRISWFLRHLWSTDGSITMKSGWYAPSIYYATSSEKLARGVQSLLLRFGITSWLRLRSQREKGRDQYHVAITGTPDIHRFADSVGAMGQQKHLGMQAILSYLKGRTTNTNRDIIPNSIWQGLVVPEMRTRNITTREFMASIRTAYSGTSIYKQNVSRERALRIATAVKSEQLERLAKSEVYWDQVTSIEPDGVEEVYDLTVDKYHNFIANDIIVHNSIEQDADVVMFIYREDMYKGQNSKRPNVAEIHIKKHRNGPTGKIDLFFDAEKTAFRNLAKQFDTRPETVMQSLAVSAEEEFN